MPAFPWTFRERPALISNPKTTSAGRQMRLLALSAALATLVVSSACAHVPYAISGADRTRFGKNLIRVHVPGKPDPLILGASGCKLYRARYEHQDIVGWQVTLAADWAQPSRVYDRLHGRVAFMGRKYVKVYFCALAIGAGGGCTNGGNYRSSTGARPWQVSVDNGKGLDTAAEVSLSGNVFD